MGHRRSRGIGFVPNPIGHLQAFAETTRVKVWRDAVDRHYTYQAIDQSARTRDVRVRACFDHKPECATCRPFVIDDEVDRILEAFGEKTAFISVAGGSDRERVRRLAGDLGCSYVFVPCGPGVVLSTGSLSEHSVEADDLEAELREVVMKVRWKGQISGSRGFLSPVREPAFWEAYHPSTARRCYHAHGTKDSAKGCAERTGRALDGSSEGWYARPASEWRQLGTLRPDIARQKRKNARSENPKPISVLVMAELEAIARRVGLEPVRGRSRGWEMVFDPMDWDDARFVEFREIVRWKQPGKVGARWQPPIFPVTLRVDGRGRATGAS
jgi:hypothetical protein